MTTTTTRRTLATLSAVGVTAGLLLTPAMAFAKGDDSRQEKETAGMCSLNAVWKLELKERDGGIEAEWEVDSGTAGEQWTYEITLAGSPIASGSATTAGVSGSFSVEVSAPGAGINDAFAATAANSASGQTCDSTGPTGVTPGAGDDDGPGDDNGSGDDDGPGDDNGSGNDDGPGDDNGSGKDDRPGDDNGGNRPERASGECTAASTWGFRVKDANKSVRARVLVSSGQQGHKWTYRMSLNGDQFAKGTKTSRGSNGVVKIKERAAVRKASGAEVKAVVTNTSTDESCVAQVQL